MTMRTAVRAKTVCVVCLRGPGAQAHRYFAAGRLMGHRYVALSPRKGRAS